jgi:hypothetical protein
VYGRIIVKLGENRKISCVDRAIAADYDKWDSVGGYKAICRFNGVAMKNTSVENALRCLLAALMLLATSATHSTYVHGHSGGNRSHEHDGPDCFTRSQLPVTPYDGNATSVCLSADDIHRHQCFALFGSITYKSASGEQTDSHGKSTCCGTSVIAVSACHSVRGLSKNLTADHGGLISVANISSGCVCESKQPESFAGIAPVSPLCDRARHERSGVLLT